MAITANRFFSTDPRLISADVEDRFFTDLKTGNNTFKRTASTRFLAVDRLCVRSFTAARAGVRTVLDVGVSSGATTLALATCLRSAGFAPAIVGTDRALTAYLARIAPGFRILLEEDGTPLQYEILGRPLRSWPRRADSFTGMVWVHRLLARISRGAIARKLAGGAGGDLRPVRLVSPRLATRADIRIEENDIFAPTAAYVGQFDFVRVANLLNLSYFDEPRLATGVTNALRYLRGPGAWLLVARCVGDAVAGTLFRVAEDGRHLLIAERFGGGSEIERIVTAAPLPAEWSRA